MEKDVNRRNFVGAVSAGALLSQHTALAATSEPALLGGKPVRTEPFPSWPVADEHEDTAMVEVVRSRRWGRGNGGRVTQFESSYAALTGARHCLATANGTSSLLACLGALDIGPGDEVIVPPYTFIATVNVVLSRHALPVFADTDIDTFQVDPANIDKAVTERTRAMFPVHLGGGSFDVDAVMAIASKRNLPVIEDACQSHLAEWKHRKVGTWGQAGCFSFQASKNLNSGEGGAILSNDEAFIEKCYTFHNNSSGRSRPSIGAEYTVPGLNLRLTEFQAAMLLSQMTRLEAQSKRREGNAAYLTSLLREIPGIHPARWTEGCTRNAYHLYMFRYDARQFNALTREAFLKALRAEGVPASGGYKPLNREPFLKNVLESRTYRNVYGQKHLSRVMDMNLSCPQNDRLCSEAVWLTQNMLIGKRSDMDQIAEAVNKIRSSSARLAHA
jgi:dTDP-4-amino-4,6-dideoxygalactose transaminase